ncbi:MAG: hypothetical protein AAGE94_25045 [Acidobacteriota bacterium]
MSPAGIRISAPGKTILAGEHAAVYGRPALVAALDARLDVTVEADPSIDGLRLALPVLDVDEVVRWDALRAYAADRRRAWEAWHADRDRRDFADVLGTEPAHLVRVAVGEALAWVLDHGGEPPSGAILRAVSEIPTGSGFGSSAAASAGCATAILALCHVDADPSVVEALALDAERRQHGTPSGVDTATVLRGGVVWVDKRVEQGGGGGLAIEPVEKASTSWLDRLQIVQTGRPAESTGEVVAAVRRLRSTDRQGFERQLARVTEATLALREGLRSGTLDAIEPIRTIHRMLDAWGIVPTPVRAVVEQVEARGGAAKISGAGSIGGPGAGSLLLHHPDPSALAGLTFPPLWRRLDVGFDAGVAGAGLQISEVPRGS